MAYRIRATFDFDWVPDGAGSTMLGQQQANDPGYGAAQAAGAVGAAQTASVIVAEAIPGGDAPSNANMQTALNAAAADAYTIITTAGSVPGFTAGTLAAQIQGWATGNP